MGTWGWSPWALSKPQPRNCLLPAESQSRLAGAFGSGVGKRNFLFGQVPGVPARQILLGRQEAGNSGMDKPQNPICLRNASCNWITLRLVNRKEFLLKPLFIYLAGKETEREREADFCLTPEIHTNCWAGT